MDTIIFLLILFVIIPIIMIVQHLNGKEDSKDTKLTEKVGKAVGIYAKGVAQEVSGLAQAITESDESSGKRRFKHSIRLDIEKAISGSWFYKRDELLKLYDENSLRKYGISSEEWKNVVYEAYAIGEVSRKCEFNGALLKNDPQSNQKHYEGTEWDDGTALREALNYLGIPKDDWIKWGYATLSMYEVGRDIEKFMEKFK